MEQDYGGGFLYAVAAGVAAGVCLAFTFATGFEFLLVCIGLAVALITLGAFARYRLAFLAAIFFAALALGVLRADSFLLQQQQSSMLPYVTEGKERAIVEGVVVNDPERRANALHVYVEVHTVNDAPAQGQLLAILERDAQTSYGNTIKLEGKIKEPEPFETNTGHLFDYKGYLEAKGISATMQRPNILLDEASAPNLYSFLYLVISLCPYDVARLKRKHSCICLSSSKRLNLLLGNNCWLKGSMIVSSLILVATSLLISGL